MASSSAPGSQTSALAAGVASYVIWGLIPLLFQALGRMGVTPWEILAQRIVWAVPAALLFVILARHGAQARIALRDPRVLSWLALSAALIVVTWAIYIWAVNTGRVLETSLGYYLTPLLNMAAGAVIFRERMNRIGLVAIGLAAVGVAIQALALGHLPLVSLALALSFCGYGIVRKRVAASAQVGLLFECVILVVPALAYQGWLWAQGANHLAAGPTPAFWLVVSGPVTALPLVMFAWAARRLPLSFMGFLQFIAPSITFVLGLLQGEPFTPARALSFAFIWGGAVVFAWGAWRRSRAVVAAIAETSP